MTATRNHPSRVVETSRDHRATIARRLAREVEVEEENPSLSLGYVVVHAAPARALTGEPPR